MSTQVMEDRRSGWLTFAAVLMFTVCFVRIITGINYLAGGSQIADLTNSVFGNQLWVWGLWDLGLSVLAFFAGASLLVNGGFGCVTGYIWAAWAIVQSFLIIQLAPWFAISMIAIGFLVIWGLATTSGELVGEEL